MAFKIRAKGARPYSVEAKNFSGTVVHTASGIATDEIGIPDLVMSSLIGGIEVKITDNDGKVAIKRWDNVTLEIMSKYHMGYSVANGNALNISSAIDDGEALEFTYTGGLIGQFDSDAAFIAFETSVCDHTDPTPSSFPLDNAIKKAYQQNHCKHIRLGIHGGFDDNKLNNGSTRTIFIDATALSMREDGVSPVDTPGPGPVPNQLVPSPSSTQFKTYMKRFALAVFKHYKAAINDGTIAFIGIPIGNSAESEYSPHGKNASGTIDVDTKGDFHEESIANFRAKFAPLYNSTTLPAIATADSNLASGVESQLGLDWSWHLSDEYAKLEAEVYDYVYANITGYTRTAVEQIDCGSLIDELSFRRRTFNVLRRIRPTTLLIKSNDDPNRSASTMRFILDHISSLGELAGCTIVEPSPQDADFGDAENRAQVVYEMQQAEERKIGISFVTSNTTDVAYLKSASGCIPGALPKPKLEYDESGPNKYINRLNVDISDVFAGSGLGYWQSQWNTFKTAEGITHVDTLSVDDLAPIAPAP